MKKKIIIAVLLLISYSCNSKKEEQNVSKNPISEKIISLTDKQLKNAELTFENIEKRNISATITANGVIDVPPQNLISISMPLGGYLKYTKLLPGMFVKKNEIGLLIDSYNDISNIIDKINNQVISQYKQNIENVKYFHWLGM